MKRITSLIFIIFLIVTISHALDHAGVINSNETWYIGSSPHHITGDILISDGVTLTIQPGCDVYFDGNYSVQVVGALVADGTDPDHITITGQGSPSNGAWKYIFFNTADAGCVLDYCDISYGGSSQGNIYMFNSYSNVSITNCTINNSGTYGIYVHQNSTPNISNCNINNNSSDGIYCYNNSSLPTINDCSFQGNTGYAVNAMSNNAGNITGTTTVTGNSNNSFLLRGGNVDTGTWLNHGVPYVIGATTTVVNEETLTIDAGTTIKISGTYTFTVQGALVADGTPAEHITFTSNQSSPSQGDWGYIYFDNTDAGSMLDYCDISYGGSSLANIYMYRTYGNVDITNCFITQSANSGIYLHQDSTPQIANCNISSNNSFGIYCAYNSSYPYISDCTIQNNVSYPIRTYGNQLKDITGTMSISGNSPDGILTEADNVSTSNWTDHGVPYIIDGNLNISDANTLTIDPETIMQFNGIYSMTVYGTLIAEGTSDDHITFTSSQSSPDNGDWNYIYFHTADEGCIMDYCDVSNGGNSLANIYIYETYDNLSLTNCNINNSGTYGIYVHQNSSPIITNCNTSNNSSYGIYCHTSSSAPEINDCTINDNGDYPIVINANNVNNIIGTNTITSNTNNSILVNGENVGNGVWHDHGVPYVINGAISVLNMTDFYLLPGCELRFNGNYNFTVNGSLTADGNPSEHITFTSNQSSPAPGDWGSVVFGQCNNGNVLDYCDISYGGSSNGGIYCYDTGSVSITNCNINNSATQGIYCYQNTSPDISNCTIQDNLGSGIQSYYNSGNPNVQDCSIINNDDYAIYTYANNVHNFTGTMTINGNTPNGIYVYGDNVYNATWKNHNVPYIIGGNISVIDGYSLFIDQGNTFKFNGNYQIYIDGLLNAQGTGAEPITFTSNQLVPSRGDWNGIYFAYTDSNSLLDYCLIEYGGSGDGNIRITDASDPTISNSTISNSGSYGIYCHQNSSPSISNCLIEDNTSAGIYCYYNSADPIISDCTIINNDSYSIYTYADNAKNITGNMVFSGNLYEGIYIFGETMTSGTWLNHDTPYIIGGDVTLSGTYTWDINYGNDIRVDGNYPINIYGQLNANGTDSDPITFTSNQLIPAPGDWKGIYFVNSSTDSNLDYCVISYGGSSYGNIRFYNAPGVSMTSCNISNSGTTGIFIQQNSNPIITDCSISDNTTHGIQSNLETGNPLISDCTIQNNGENPIVSYVNIIKNITGTITISGNGDNSIYANGGNVYDGVWLDHGVPYNISGNTTVIDGNTLTIEAGTDIQFAGNDLFSIYGSLTAEGTESEHITFTRHLTNLASWQYLYFYQPDGLCHLEYCDISYGGSGYGLIRMYGAGTNVQMDYCNLNNSNTHGIYIQTDSHPDIKNCIITDNVNNGVNISGNCVPTFGSNYTEWNDIYNNGSYNLYNGDADIDAQYIYWGTTVQQDIEDKIFDYFDNDAYGVVNFTPFSNTSHVDTPIAPPSNITIQISGRSNVNLSWDAVIGATSYTVYSTIDPNNDPATWTLEQSGITEINWSEPASGIKKFYYVKAVN